MAVSGGLVDVFAVKSEGSQVAVYGCLAAWRAGCDGTIPGEWVSLHDGETITNPSDLDLDHFVPLAEAWDSGAGDWTPAQRIDFAVYLDDDRHLVAVTAVSHGFGKPPAAVYAAIEGGRVTAC